MLTTMHWWLYYSRVAIIIIISEPLLITGKIWCLCVLLCNIVTVCVEYLYVAKSYFLVLLLLALYSGQH